MRRPSQQDLDEIGRLKKPPPRSKLDEDALKRLRVHNSQYELSQDLLDKQVELLERKYGGPRARKAALVIQRAFRKYTILKRFHDIAQASKAERRVSRRLVYPHPDTPVRSLSLRDAQTLPAPKKVPPQVPKRTSSMSGPHNTYSSDKSLHQDEIASHYAQAWRQRVCLGHESHYPRIYDHNAVLRGYQNITDIYTLTRCKVSEMHRKRQYRVGLNLFNKKPEKGISFLIQHSFVEGSPLGVARFLLTRKGLSKQMIGEYLGNLQNGFNMAVLECFVREIDFDGLEVDVALRRFQTHFRMPGEAQKIERLVEVFSQHYVHCNSARVSRLRSADTVFILAFAIIMLNTDLHSPSLKPDKRMKLEEFIRNLRGVDDGHDLDKDLLSGIYDRVRRHEFRTGSDHVTQVCKVQQTLVGKKPTLALPHRRLVCYCRLYEVYDVTRKERPHQREIFLFNDTLLVTKIFSKKKNNVTYTFKQSIPLCGLSVSLFEAPHYPYGIRLSQRVDDKVTISFNARNEHDRSKFVDDLKESVLEMDEMENLRIETELEKLRSGSNTTNRDSGVVDLEVSPAKDTPETNGSGGLKRSTLSNSLLDLHDQNVMIKPTRRGSSGSLDSGMSVSFQSSSNTSQSDCTSLHHLMAK